jgi:uridine kinase
MAQLTQMSLISIEYLESQLGVRKFPAFVEACEAAFQQKIILTAERILSRQDIRAIFVSGPTASGKTTFSDRLAQLLTRRSRPTRVLSLDDYYTTVTVHHDAQGRPDYETIDMLDTDAMVTDFNTLFSGQPVQLPTFDFVRRCRVIRPEKMIHLAADDLVVIEGLHGLSERIIGHLPPAQVFGVFIMPWCTLLDGRQLLGSRDLRMLRRISRDVMHRGSTALSTIDYWPMIDHTEAHFFPPYLARADEYINSSLAYEFCIIPHLATARIEQSLRLYRQGTLPGSIYLQDGLSYADLSAAVAEAEELLSACSRLPEADLSIVPPESILQEFIR